MLHHDMEKQHHNGKDRLLEQDLFLVKEKLLETKEAISKTAQDAKHRASDIINHSLDEMKERSMGLKQDAELYVKKHPVKSLGFAALVGLLVGQWFRKSK